MWEIKKLSQDEQLAIKEWMKNSEMEEVQTDNEGVYWDQIKALTQKEIQSITKNEQIQKRLKNMKNVTDCL